MTSAGFGPVLARPFAVVSGDGSRALLPVGLA